MQSYDGASQEELQTLEMAVSNYLQPALFALERVAADLLSSVGELNDTFKATAEAFDAFTKA